MALKTPQTISDRFDQKVFNAIYSRALVYNTCWEDPAVDRLALNIAPDDALLVITSAGCNVLDYALTGPRSIHAVDANPRQNALLELKLSGIRSLDYDDFFAAFGSGYHPRFREIYFDALRAHLSPFARGFWDKRVDWFGNPRGSFYYHGLSGIVARLFRLYLAARPRLAASISDLFETRSLDHQRHVYDLTRKHYLLGRDRLIADLDPPRGGTVLEIGCGTGRNIIAAARRYPHARFFGLDISDEMLMSARANVDKAGLSGRISLARADATAFEAKALFAQAAFDRVFISYSLSMIPPWRETIRQALDCLEPGGSLHIVDFGRQEGLPGWFRSGLRAWLARFHVEPRDTLHAVLESEAQRAGASLSYDSLYRGYAIHAVMTRQGSIR